MADMGIKRFIQNRKLASAKPFKPTRRWRPGENSLQLAGLILCMDDTAEIELLKKVQKFLTKEGAVCRTCIYQKNTKTQIPEELIKEGTLLLNQESVNWYGQVRHGHAASFIDESYDLIINLSKNYFFTTTHIAFLSKATLKIGRYEWPLSPYRIVLGTNQNNDINAFIDLLDRNLKIIKFE